MCNDFADPYVEHDSLTLLLDLILLKRGVYLHLLYNRGTEPRKAGITPESVDDEGPSEIRRRERERVRQSHVLPLCPHQAIRVSCGGCWSSGWVVYLSSSTLVRVTCKVRYWRLTCLLESHQMDTSEYGYGLHCRGLAFQ